MTQVYEPLMRAPTFNAYMAQAKTTEQKMEFVLKALTQYERDADHRHPAMPPSQVVVHPQVNTCPDYMLSYHTIRIPFAEEKSCTEYMCNMEHEHEHAQQRLGIGYTEQEKRLCDASFAVYPANIYTPNGYLNPFYAYNYTELRALQAEAEFIHRHYHGRMNATPPDCFTPEKQEILQRMKTLKEQLDGRPQKSMALDVNNKNARRALFGKYNAAYANGMSRWQMHRTFKSGAKLIKQTLKDLKKLSKTLGKDIEELEKALSPEHAAETAKKEQTQRMEYEQVLAKTVGDLARSVGFTINGPMPNDQSYSVCQCNSLSLLEFYLKGFNPELQYNPAAAGHLNIQEMPGDIYLVMVPKTVADLVKRPEQYTAPIIQSTMANDGITFDDKINVDAMALFDAR